MTVGFSTTCKGRLHHLERTLPHNLEVSVGYPVRFHLVNYDSPDGLHEWVQERGYDISYQRLVNRPFFNPSHAKNVAQLMCTQDFVVNLDADVFLSKEALDFLMRLSLSDFTVALAPSLYGFVGLPRSVFLELRGYDEGLPLGWGVEDVDLWQRLKCSNLSFKQMPTRFLSPIVHSDGERVKYFDGKNKADGNRLKKKWLAERKFPLNPRGFGVVTL